jgi:hypothetical protein
MTTASETFFQMWTHGEAYLKATGRGVAIDSAGGPVSVGGEGTPAAWFTHALTAPAGDKAALATSFSRPDVHDVTRWVCRLLPLFRECYGHHHSEPRRRGGREPVISIAGRAAKRASRISALQQVE